MFVILVIIEIYLCLKKSIQFFWSIIKLIVIINTWSMHKIKFVFRDFKIVCEIFLSIED